MPTMEVEKTCACCGKRFIHNDFRNINKKKFCSKECRTKDYNRARWERVKLPPPEPRVCLVCGKIFTPDSSHRYAVACGKECNIKKQQAIGKRTRDEVRAEKLKNGKICKYCGKIFYPTSLNKKHCSDECLRLSHNQKSREYEKKLPKGEKTKRNAQTRWNGNWLKAMKRDGNKCVLCGSIEGLNAHHLDGKGEKEKGKRRPNNTNLENLIVLCKQCHKDIHGVFVIKDGDGWVVRGDIFKKLGLTGSIKIT